MPASREDILRWLGTAGQEGARWVVIKCDAFDFHGSPGDRCCYPVAHTDPQEVHKTMGNSDRTMEVYDLELSVESQMAERRAWHPPE